MEPSIPPRSAPPVLSAPQLHGLVAATTKDDAHSLKQKACGTPLRVLTLPPGTPPSQSLTKGPSLPTHPSKLPSDHNPYIPFPSFGSPKDCILNQVSSGSRITSISDLAIARTCCMVIGDSRNDKVVGGTGTKGNIGRKSRASRGNRGFRGLLNIGYNGPVLAEDRPSIREGSIPIATTHSNCPQSILKLEKASSQHEPLSLSS
jgi:hypothetical protein